MSSKREGIAFVFSAPSGTGKTTVCKILRERLPTLRFSVSHTTRQPRPGETDGEDYFFVSEAEFESRVNNNEFLEWAKVHGNYYGTASATVEDVTANGHDLLLDLDVQGVQSLRQLNFPGVFIFLLPPSLEELRWRLINRGTEPETKILKRIETGKTEITQYPLYDYVVTNSDLEQTVGDILAIFQAEKCRAYRYVPGSGDIEALLKNAKAPGIFLEKK